MKMSDVVYMLVMWPAVAAAEVQYGEYVPALVGVATAYLVSGQILPWQAQDLQQLVVPYVAGGAAFIGANMVVKNRVRVPPEF